jgi:hypothetical protein
MKKIISDGLIAGVAMIIANMVLNAILNLLFPFLRDFYAQESMFRAMDDPLMILFFFYPLVLGVGFAWVWDKTKHLFSGNVHKKAMDFGTIYFFLVGLPMLLINVGSFAFEFVVIFSWMVMSLINGLVGGWVVANRDK